MEKLTVLICNREKSDRMTEDFQVLSLTLPMPKNLLIERMKNICATHTKILEYAIKGYLEDFELPVHTNIFSLNLLMNFLSNLDEDEKPEFMACLEYWHNLSYNNIIQKFKEKKYRFGGHEVYDYAELGEYLTQNEIDNYFISDSLIEFIDLEKLGKSHQREHHGMFTSFGYIEKA